MEPRSDLAPAEARAHAARRGVVGPLVLLAAALVGALGAWLVVEQFQVYEFFIAAEPPPELANRSETDPELQAAESELARVALYRNSMLLIGLTGGCVGACLGLADGALRRSIGSAALKLLAGALMGVAFGSAGGLAQVFVGCRSNGGRSSIRPSERWPCIASPGC